MLLKSKTLSIKNNNVGILILSNKYHYKTLSYLETNIFFPDGIPKNINDKYWPMKRTLQKR